MYTITIFFGPFGINNVGNYCIQIASVSVSFIIHNIIIKLSGCKVYAFDTAL
jgi:spore maturation protein SpmB